MDQTDHHYCQHICEEAVEAAQAAMSRFPQPNYVLLKVAEEAGEVVKAGVHLAEGRDFTFADMEGECIQTIAMCLRLLVEGDAVVGVPSWAGAPRSATQKDLPSQQGAVGADIGQANRSRVRDFLVTHPGATQKDAAEALGLSIQAVSRHVRALRAEWKGRG